MPIRCHKKLDLRTGNIVYLSDERTRVPSGKLMHFIVVNGINRIIHNNDLKYLKDIGTCNPNTLKLLYGRK